MANISLTSFFTYLMKSGGIEPRPGPVGPRPPGSRWTRGDEAVAGVGEVPIIVISARDQEKDKVRTLDAGADDYLTQLRHKLEADPARPEFLINEPGVGYRLRTDDAIRQLINGSL